MGGGPPLGRVFTLLYFDQSIGFNIDGVTHNEVHQRPGTVPLGVGLSGLLEHCVGAEHLG